MTDNFKKYFDLKSQIKVLQDELKEIEPEVFKVVAMTDDGKLTTDYCRFQVVYRPKWEYTKELIEKENLVKDQIKLAKRKEEIEGKAIKITDGGQLRMTGLKE